MPALALPMYKTTSGNYRTRLAWDFPRCSRQIFLGIDHRETLSDVTLQTRSCFEEDKKKKNKKSRKRFSLDFATTPANLDPFTCNNYYFS